MYDYTEAFKAIDAALKGADIIDKAKGLQGNKLDDLLGSIQSAEEGMVSIHDYWNAYYDAKGLAYKVYDATENKMKTIDGAKAQGKIQTYKSQTIKAYQVNKTMMQFASWSEMKEAIASVPDPAIETFNEIAKDLKDTLKKMSDADKVGFLARLALFK